MQNKYRIQIRKYSSNVIEQLVSDANGKEKWTVAICPTLKKSDGDILCETLLKSLNTPQPQMYYVFAPGFQQLSNGFESFNQAAEFRNDDYNKKHYGKPFIISTLKEI